MVRFLVSPTILGATTLIRERWHLFKSEYGKVLFQARRFLKEIRYYEFMRRILKGELRPQELRFFCVVLLCISINKSLK